MRIQAHSLAAVALAAGISIWSASTTADETPQSSASGRALQAQTYVIGPGDDVQFQLQARLINAVPGDVIQLEAGRYKLLRQLDVAADNLTIRGRGADKTILSFQGQTSGGQGLEATGNNFTLEGLAIEDTAGNAVKVLGARNVTFRDVRVEWTAEPSSHNGAYGIYPVQCQNVLLEKCVAIGASDAGLYVGQCTNVVVRSCRAERNVAGIEIENTIDADVYDNLATNNSGGILVFDMPGLPQKAGRNARVLKNQVVANNHRNFADAGAIVAAIPPGTGVMVMASDYVEVFDNDIQDNQTCNVLVVSYLATEKKINDKNFDPISEFVSIHDNRIAKGGDKPQGRMAEMLKLALGAKFADILWDGVVNPKATEPTLRMQNNGAATYANFNLPKLSPENILQGKYKVERDSTALAAKLEPLAAVRLAPHDPPAATASAAVQVYRSLPKKLSEYGLFAGPQRQLQPASGVVLYDLNTPLFSDFAAKQRLIRLPAGKQIEYRASGVLEFPVGTVIAKTFYYPREQKEAGHVEHLLETRIELRTADGWYGAAYRWNDEQTEAELSLGGGEIEVQRHEADGQRGTFRYQIPNANQCLNCHSQDKAFVPLGPTAINLNRPAPTGQQPPNQLSALAEAHLLDRLPELSTIGRLPTFDNPHSGNVEQRARAWLDVNCAHCHNPRGTARTSGLDLRWEQSDLARLGMWKNPVAAGHGSGGRKYDIVPGKPDESILLYRLESQDPSIMMPNVGRRLVFDEAVSLVREWIEGMPSSE